MRFRPCIDLHDGKVKQIVGSTLRDEPGALRANFSSPLPASHYASLYRRDQLPGGHVVMLGPGNEAAAAEALAAWPGGLQVGGGVTADNAERWLARGASHVIVTSWIFREGQVDMQRLAHLAGLVGKAHLVLDLSCRFRENAYYVVSEHWQRFTSLRLDGATLSALAAYCDEFLVHAVDVEGTCTGLDAGLLALLAEAAPIPTTYAGGISSMADLELVERVGRGRIDATVGSALDIFGGQGIKYSDILARFAPAGRETAGGGGHREGRL